jgi:hypothetical protein
MLLKKYGVIQIKNHRIIDQDTVEIYSYIYYRFRSVHRNFLQDVLDVFSAAAPTVHATLKLRSALIHQ